MATDSDTPFYTIGSPSSVVNINPYTEEMWKALSEAYSGGSSWSTAQNYYNQASNLYSGLNTYQDQLTSLSNQLNDLYAGNINNILQQAQNVYGQTSSDLSSATSLATQIANLQSYDPEAALNALLSRIPELQGVASTLTQESLGDYASELTEQKNILTSNAIKDVANQFAGQGINSGAALKAAVEAAATPAAEMATNLASTQSDVYSNLINNLLSSAYSDLSSQYQYAYGAEQSNLATALEGLLGVASGRSTQTNALNTLLSGLSTGSDILSNQGNLLSTQAGLNLSAASGLAGLGSQYQTQNSALLNLLGGLSQAEYWQPSYVANPDYMSSSDELTAAINVWNMANSTANNAANVAASLS